VLISYPWPYSPEEHLEKTWEEFLKTPVAQKLTEQNKDILELLHEALRHAIFASKQP
jgi:hypothetical protein